MAFVFERSDKWTPDEAEQIRKWIDQDPKKRGVSSWVVDRDRGLALLCFSVGRIGEDWWPGEYTLYVQGVPVTLKADMSEVGEPHVARKEQTWRYEISRIAIPPELEVSRAEILDLLRDAFQAEGRSLSGRLATVVSVIVDFK